jgi:hypothetical protein
MTVALLGFRSLHGCGAAGESHSSSLTFWLQMFSGALSGLPAPPSINNNGTRMYADDRGLKQDNIHHRDTEKSTAFLLVLKQDQNSALDLNPKNRFCLCCIRVHQILSASNC